MVDKAELEAIPAIDHDVAAQAVSINKLDLTKLGMVADTTIGETEAFKTYYAKLGEFGVNKEAFNNYLRELITKVYNKGYAIRS